VNQQVAAFLLEEEELPVAADSNETPANAGCRRRPLRLSRRCTFAQLARKCKLPGLCTVLEVEDGVILFFCDSLHYGIPSAPRIGRVANTIRGAESFYEAAW